MLRLGGVAGEGSRGEGLGAENGGGSVGDGGGEGSVGGWGFGREESGRGRMQCNSYCAGWWASIILQI